MFKLHKEKKTWDEAVKACRAEGAQLVIVDNKSINDWLAKIDMKLGVIWIGATDNVSSLVFLALVLASKNSPALHIQPFTSIDSYLTRSE